MVNKFPEPGTVAIIKKYKLSYYLQKKFYLEVKNDRVSA